MPKRKPHLDGRSKKPSAATTDPETIFFYLPNEQPYGVFCQWHPSPITLPTASLHFLGVQSPATTTTTITTTTTAAAILGKYDPDMTFICAEQVYMFAKALFFGGAWTCTRILATSDPKEQKKLGQRVEGLNEWKWTQVKSRVVRVGNWYKFRGKGRLRDVLLGTGEKESAEANRSNRVWGIG
ncbi:hypothetical protein K458DRAFT_265379, partial [Lentithecium fluviatile CBS 122367]